MRMREYEIFFSVDSWSSFFRTTVNSIHVIRLGSLLFIPIVNTYNTLDKSMLNVSILYLDSIASMNRAQHSHKYTASDPDTVLRYQVSNGNRLWK